MRTSRAAGLQVYEWGDHGAPPLLFWDGRGGGGLHANELAPALVEEYGFRVIAPDPPGHGRSRALPPASSRPSQIAAVVEQLLRELGLGSAVFVGFSVGAEIGCAVARRSPSSTKALVLVEGGHWDFADLPSTDTETSLEAWIARVRDERYPSWEAFFAAEGEALQRWTPALEQAHRSMMREEDGAIVPIAGRETLGAIDWGNCVEPTVSTHAVLREHGIPVLLVTCRERGPVAEAGVRRFRENVPQLRVSTLPGDVHDLVSHAPLELARIIGDWLRD